jgi:hypothetical protein
MGLDVSHNCWHGAYSAFSRWRQHLAKLAGVPLGLMEGFYQEPYRPAMEWAAPRDGGPICNDMHGPILHNWLTLDVLPYVPIKWESLKPDVLHVLLNHSDCDGDIPVKYLKPLADRLEELNALPGADVDLFGHVGDFRMKTQKFIDGLRLAASKRQKVTFG